MTVYLRRMAYPTAPGFHCYDCNKFSRSGIIAFGGWRCARCKAWHKRWAKLQAAFSQVRLAH